MRSNGAAADREIDAAELPILADLAEVGIEVDTVWDVYRHPGRARAVPILIEHLGRDYPDMVLRGMGNCLADTSARPWWDDLKQLYLTTTRDVVRDRLGAALSVCAARPHFDDLLRFIHDESLGTTRIYFVRPLNRIGNRIEPGRGRSIIQSLASDPVLGVEANAVLKGRSPKD